VDIPVLVVASIVLVGGFAYARTTEPAARDVTAFGGKVRLRLPSGWCGARHEGAYEAERPTLGGIAPTLRIERITPARWPREGERPPEGEYLVPRAPREAPPPELSLDHEIARMELRRETSGVGYRVLRTEEREAFGGHPAHFTEYALVREPPGATAGGAHLPILVVGTDVLVRVGERLYQISIQGPADEIDDDHPIHELLRSVRISR
jgi:hypothetical protein